MVPDEDGKYNEIWTVKDRMGPKASLEASLEERISSFVRDSTRLGFPRIQNRFLVDIGVFMEMHQIDVERFLEGVPGKCYVFLLLFYIAGVGLGI